MKVVIIAALLSVVSSAFGYETVNCISVRGTDRELELKIANQDLKFVMDLGLRRSVVVTKLANQNMNGKTLYSVLGSFSLIEVENSVLNNEGGNIRFEGDELSCM